MQQTSLEAYRSIQATLNEKQQALYEKLLKYHPVDFTDYEIGKMLGWPINTVTPRRGELEDAGLVVHVASKVNAETGRRAMTWRAVKIE